MSDYTAFSGDERAPLTRAFVDAFRRAMETRDALGRATEAPLEVLAQGESVADKVATQLASVTRRLAREAMAWTGAAGETDIAAAQYAFVALLDELLLFSDWPGHAAWEARPLEVRVFGTRAAGERLPDAIEALLTQRDASQRDLANVYLACLILGFRGRLRGEAGALRHDQLRHALFAFAMQRDAEPAHLAAPLERVALAPRRTVTLSKMFPDHVRFAALLGVGVCVLLGVSHLLWSVATADVQRSVMQFQAIALADTPAAPASSTSVSGAVVRVPVKPRAQPSTTDAPALPQSNALAAIPAVPAVDTNTVVLRTAADGGGNRP
ncbi:DotU family type IV/VI secretion system protein [Paraburkholderia phenazinium]|uniref:Type VI secretion system protein ImpK n=1 Tax=Paraburkholderia phenazinium TaxID=60549 RepID=A0A1N6KQW8_9BURK|nr:DotU family type IV/VI secretion system protein [Paraburkholderia phenazinium]SIO58920.1 type VI secretion system protein ImpK [Paraburkholderia phenazinium]